MFRSKQFVKKTRKGNIVSVAREHYLRDDISCGSKACETCKSSRDDMVKPLSEDPESMKTHSLGFPHYLVLDTNIVLHHIDLLEAGHLRNVIIPQTVDDEVKNQNLAVHTKLRGLTGSQDSGYYLFNNEHHRATYLERQPNESSNDRNDRAIRQVASWYDDHLKEKTGIGTVLITDDRECRRRAETENGLYAFSMRQYVNGALEHVDEMMDLLGRTNRKQKQEDQGGVSMAVDDEEEDEDEKKLNEVLRDDTLYAEHLSLVAVQKGLREGLYFSGGFNLSSDNSSEAFVLNDAHDKPILIKGIKDMNRATSRDVVAVRLYPKDQWQVPSQEFSAEPTSEVTRVGENIVQTKIQYPLVAPSREDKKDETVSSLKPDNQTDSMETTVSEGTDIHPTGYVVSILRRNWRPCVGVLLPESLTLEQNTLSGEERTLAICARQGNIQVFKPQDRGIPNIYLVTRQAARLADQRIVVAIDSWDQHSLYPRGHLVKSLGKIGDRNTETTAILLENKVPHHKFNARILAELPPMPWIANQELEKVRSGASEKIPVEPALGKNPERVDLRHLEVVSIDPPGCTDIDDTLHARMLDDEARIAEVGVHIADVTHFVKAGGTIDAEAADRGTTVYLTDRRIDMLPELLGTDLCSLKSDVDRFAFSVVWKIKVDTAEVLEARFCKSIIRSRYSFEYTEAQARIDDINNKDSITNSMRLLNSLAKILKGQRMAKGALKLESPEINFDMDNETMDPIEVRQKKHVETNSLVEEFMLLANVTVAKKITDHFPGAAVLRRHPEPPASRFEPLVLAGQRLGFHIDVTSSKKLAESLDAADVPKKPYINSLLRILATRCMYQAVYFSSGNFPEHQFHHYGLAAPIYTHFTSPIRRYADVLVHRLLAAAIGYEPIDPGLLESRKVQKRCEVINRRQRAAQQASRASVALYTQMFFRSKGAQEEHAYVLQVRKNGIGVMIPKYGLEGIIVYDEASVQHDAVNHTIDVPDPQQPQKKDHESKRKMVRITVFDEVLVTMRLSGNTFLAEQMMVLDLKQKVIYDTQENTSNGDQEPPTKKQKMV
eukprot:Clim_evm8s49 gene=Clim_evmTU8s49